MIFGSCAGELKKSYPTADTSGFEMVFRLNDGSKNAFVAVTNDGKYPSIFNNEDYPPELLEKEVIGIIERYCVPKDSAKHNDDSLYADEWEIEHRIQCRKRIQILSNAVMVCFFVFGVLLFVRIMGF